MFSFPWKYQSCSCCRCWASFQMSGIVWRTLQCAGAIWFYLISIPPWEPLLSSTDHSTFSVLPPSIDSQRSHLSSFTMKLMDKFHSPKIKRTPSKKGKQLQPEPTAKSTEKPANKVCVQPCARKYVCIVGNPPLSHLFWVFVCLFVRRLLSCLMFCASNTPLCLCVCEFPCWFPQLPSRGGGWPH